MVAKLNYERCLKDNVYLKSVDKFKPKCIGPHTVTYKHSPVSLSNKRLYVYDDTVSKVILIELS